MDEALGALPLQPRNGKDMRDRLNGIVGSALHAAFNKPVSGIRFRLLPLGLVAATSLSHPTRSWMMMLTASTDSECRHSKQKQQNAPVDTPKSLWPSG